MFYPLTTHKVLNCKTSFSNTSCMISLRGPRTLLVETFRRTRARNENFQKVIMLEVIYENVYDENFRVIKNSIKLAKSSP